MNHIILLGLALMSGVSLVMSECDAPLSPEHSCLAPLAQTLQSVGNGGMPSADKCSELAEFKAQIADCRSSIMMDCAETYKQDNLDTVDQINQNVDNFAAQFCGQTGGMDSCQAAITQCLYSNLAIATKLQSIFSNSDLNLEDVCLTVDRESWMGLESCFDKADCPDRPTGEGSDGFTSAIIWTIRSLPSFCLCDSFIEKYEQCVSLGTNLTATNVTKEGGCREVRKFACCLRESTMDCPNLRVLYPGFNQDGESELFSFLLACDLSIDTITSDVTDDECGISSNGIHPVYSFGLLSFVMLTSTLVNYSL